MLTELSPLHWGDELCTDAEIRRRLDPQADARIFSATANDRPPDRGAGGARAGGELPVWREETEARRDPRRRRRRAHRPDLRGGLPGELYGRRPRRIVEGIACKTV